ncbi:hypothetical protein L7F22_035918 [Adiantum nelumboides]|nr:hypothetical protein [Adiantum nelumboides]
MLRRSALRFEHFRLRKIATRPFEHSSANHIIIRFALELIGKPYDLPASSNASRITKRLADGCSKSPRCVFSALNCVKLQYGPSEHPSVSRITIRLALDLADKPYDLPTSSNASRLIIRLVDECSEGSRCVFSALDCIKLQRGPSEHPSAKRITIRLALELVDKPYDLPASSNASRLTIRLVDGSSEGPHCVFSALNCVKLQHRSFEHSSASCITIRFALELAGKPYDLRQVLMQNVLPNGLPMGARKLTGKSYDLLASSNASRLTIRLADGCSEDPRYVFSTLNCVKLQRGSSEHPLASRITIRLALELAGPRCVFSALDCVKLQRGLSEHPSASRITIRFALELAGKPSDLPASSNARRITKRLADGCSKGPRCVFSALNCVKLQRRSFEHPSASRITIRLALEFVDKPYDLPASSNANRLTIRLVDGCSKGPRCVFSALDCVKLQRGPSEHPSASCIIVRLALKFADKPYDLSASSNAKCITKRLADGCSKSPRCVFSALNSVKLQRGPSEHPSANRITIRFALEFIGKSYDLPTSSNASRLTIRALDCVKLQRGPSEHSSTSRITIRLALELAGKSYDLSESSNANRITKRLADGCSKGPRSVFSALNCIKLQRGSSEYPSTSRITIRLALELAGKSYDLSTNSNTSRITKWLVDGCSEDPRCVFSALDYVKLQRGSSEHPSASCITIRFALEFVDKPYDLSASSNASRITKRLADGCSKGSHYVFSALNCVKL